MRKALAPLIFLFIATFCAPALAGGKRIVTTFLPLQIFTLNVAGEMAEVSLLIPPGSDVHDFTLRPMDLKKLREADLLVINGAGLEGSIMDKMERGKRVVDTSEGIDLIREAANSPNPHVWLDPMLAVEQVRNISGALAGLDPENAVHYNQNAEAYVRRLTALNSEIMKGLNGLKGAYLITYHESFLYFARRYGLRSYSLTGAHAEQPLPRRVKFVYDTIRKEGVKAVFAEEQFPRDALKRVASDLGVRLCTLNSLASGEERKDYYERAMRENLKRIAGCLGGD
jgi:zinc/manganese transport system substrate-binding protein